MEEQSEATPPARRHRSRRLPLRRLCQAAALGLFLLLLFHVAWPYATPFRTDLFASKERVPAELFLWLDPLVVLTGAVGHALRLGFLWLGGLLALSLFIPRVFCSHVCPLGTLLDLFGWAIGSRLRRLHVTRRGAWVHTRYYVLAAVVVAAFGGVALAGYVAAIPLVVRGLTFVLGPLQVTLLKHSGLVPPLGPGTWASVAGFAAVVGLGLLGRRFWCRYVCPSGALFSLWSLLRVRERRVTEACVHCGKCVAACSFDAIREDFSTRPLDCAFCPDCAAACPVDAIAFGWRRRGARAPEREDGPAISRRAFAGASAAGAVAAVGLAALGAPRHKLLRPPGSVAEERFLELCVRCGLCMKACPGPVLHPAGLGAGLDALWTPVAVPSWAGCHQECNFCGQVCPTGAIRPLAVEAKRRTHMGLAKVNPQTCLPHRGERDCQLCYDECEAAGYGAITMVRKRLHEGDGLDAYAAGLDPEEALSILVPEVDAEKCVGCGLCEYRCQSFWVKQKHVLDRSAIIVVAENEHRPG